MRLVVELTSISASIRQTLNRRDHRPAHNVDDATGQARICIESSPIICFRRRGTMAGGGGGREKGVVLDSGADLGDLDMSCSNIEPRPVSYRSERERERGGCVYTPRAITANEGRWWLGSRGMAVRKRVNRTIGDTFTARCVKFSLRGIDTCSASLAAIVRRVFSEFYIYYINI